MRTCTRAGHNVTANGTLVCQITEFRFFAFEVYLRLFLSKLPCAKLNSAREIIFLNYTHEEALGICFITQILEESYIPIFKKL